MIRGLPDKLKELRTRKNLSQKDAANRLGISPSIISGYETGERTPSVENLLSLSYLYHCSTDYLLGKNEEIPIEFLDISDLDPEQKQAFTVLVNAIREK